MTDYKTLNELLDNKSLEESEAEDDLYLYKELDVKSLAQELEEKPEDEESEDDLKDNQIKVRATDTSVDRHGDIVLTEGLLTEAFMKNPVVLDGHDTRKRVGKVIELEKQPDQMIMTIELDVNNPDEDKATKAESLLHEAKNGFLNTVSIGFRALEVEPREDGSGFLIKKGELVELSLVTIPANPNATVVERSYNSPAKKGCNHNHVQSSSANIAKWFGSEDIQHLRKAAQTILAITDHDDRSLAKGSMHSLDIGHKALPQDLEDELDRAIDKAASNLASLGREVKDAWREEVRDNPDTDNTTHKRTLRERFLPAYEEKMLEDTQAIWEEESERFKQELVDKGIVPEDLELGLSTNFDSSLEMMIREVAEEALNRELGWLARQQIEITRSTPPGTDRPTRSQAMETLGVATLATVASEAIAAGFNSGRDRVMSSAEEDDRVEDKMIVKRNEVLDENTCDECERLDGYEAKYGTYDYYEHSPPNFCKGRGRCRGFWDVEEDKADPRHETANNASISNKNESTKLTIGEDNQNVDLDQLCYELTKQDLNESDPLDALFEKFNITLDTED